MISGEDRKIVLAALIDVSRRTLNNGAGDAAQFCAKREVSTPSGRIDTGSLLHDNHVARFGGLYGSGAQVSRRRRSAFIKA
jgi:hypothetical protein